MSFPTQFPPFAELELMRLDSAAGEFKRLVSEYRRLHRKLLAIQIAVDKQDRQHNPTPMDDLDSLGTMVEEIKEELIDFP